MENRKNLSKLKYENVKNKYTTMIADKMEKYRITSKKNIEKIPFLDAEGK